MVKTIIKIMKHTDKFLPSFAPKSSLYLYPIKIAIINKIIDIIPIGNLIPIAVNIVSPIVFIPKELKENIMENIENISDSDPIPNFLVLVLFTSLI